MLLDVGADVELGDDVDVDGADVLDEPLELVVEPVVVVVLLGSDEPDWSPSADASGSVSVEADGAGHATTAKATSATTSAAGAAAADNRYASEAPPAWARPQSRDPPMTLWPSAPHQAR